jgi:Domain of unknown function (DUF4265)
VPIVPCYASCSRKGNRVKAGISSLKSDIAFAITVEDGWPPFPIENLPCTILKNGIRVDAPPLFIKGLSVGDVINIENSLDTVQKWTYIKKSKRTTVWLGLTDYEIDLGICFDKLKKLSCNIVAMKNIGCYSIDVPETCEIVEVDKVLDQVANEGLFVVFPSFRHDNSD